MALRYERMNFMISSVKTITKLTKIFLSYCQCSILFCLVIIKKITLAFRSSFIIRYQLYGSNVVAKLFYPNKLYAVSLSMVLSKFKELHLSSES